jgi:uncharacterized protein YdeI (YjbR/CyaY-like superfamily)
MTRKMPVHVEDYLRDGCGRCDRFATPACKVHRWARELEALRALVRTRDLTEEVKWGSPCYTRGGKNVVMIGAFNEHCALQFFNGAALADPSGVLESPGPNSRFGRYLKFRSLEDVRAHRAAAEALLDAAIALAQSGTKFVPSAPAEPMPEELAARLASDDALREAFAALTPGRRRSHVLHVSGAKQSETRARRAERCAQDILAGRGFNERS